MPVEEIPDLGAGVDVAVDGAGNPKARRKRAAAWPLMAAAVYPVEPHFRTAVTIGVKESRYG